MAFKPDGLKDLYFPKLCFKEFLSCVDKQNYCISDEQTDDCDISNHIKAVYTRENIITNKFKNCSEGVIVKQFTSYCNSFYCAQLWCL